MTRILYFTAAFITVAHAGPSSKALVPPPDSDPCLTSWFAGASVGYLTELEEAMYTVHFGVDPCWLVAGGRVSLFAEVGFTRREEDYSAGPVLIPLPGNIEPDSDFDLDDLEAGLEDSADTGVEDTGYRLRILPITLNAQYERQIYGGLHGYLGAGLGMAWLDLEADAGSFGRFDENDWVFTTHIFGGLSYAVTPSIDVFGGVRWIYYDDAELGGGTFEMDDDFLVELGGRFRF